MTEGRHYRVDLVTFNQILGFGEEERGSLIFMMRLELRSVILPICGLTGEVQMGRLVA